MRNLSDSPSGSFTARPGPDLHAAMIESAQRDGVSLSSWVNDLCARAVGRTPIVPRTLKDLRDLGTLSEDQESRLHGPHDSGVTVVTGPINSGKTTLIRAMLHNFVAYGASEIAVISPDRREYQSLDDGWTRVIFYDDTSFDFAQTANDNDITSVALDIVTRLNRRDVSVIVCECRQRDVYSKIAAELARQHFAQKIILETHGSDASQALSRLSHLGITVDERLRRSVACLNRNLSTGEVVCTITK